uniref:G-protein coupled receptors family 2 profile 2 domain-containing protein n=1 Tax=Tetranychus urticae TaxID=32264 RepID=T1KKL9_TETUR
MSSRQFIILIIATIAAICNSSFDFNKTIPSSATLTNFGFQGHHEVTWYFNLKKCSEYEVYDKVNCKCRRVYCRSPYGDLPVRKCSVKEALDRFIDHEEFIDLEAEKWTIRITVDVVEGKLILGKETRKKFENRLAEWLNIPKDRIEVEGLTTNGSNQGILEVQLTEDIGMPTTNNDIAQKLKQYASFGALLYIEGNTFQLLHAEHSVSHYVSSFCDGAHDRRLIIWDLDFEMIGQNILLNKANGRRYKKGTYLGSILVYNDALKVAKFAMLCEKVTGFFCEKIKLPPGSYEFVADGREVRSQHGVTNKFEIDAESNVKICEQATFFCIVSETENTIVALCLVVSSIFLLLILITFTMVPDIASTLPGFNTINLVLTILILQLLFLTGSQWSDCWLAAIVIHYFILLNFSWSSIIGFHIFRTFVSFGSMQYPKNSHFSNRFYSFVMAHLMVLIIMGAALVNELLSNDFAPHFGAYQGVCWIRNSIGVLFYFAIPVSLSNLLNAIFYLASFIKIKQSLEESFAVSTWTGKSIRSMPVQLTVFSRIATVLSISWITVLLIPITPPKSLPHQLAKYLFSWNDLAEMG